MMMSGKIRGKEIMMKAGRETERRPNERRSMG
jgi:hypothetical protein